MKKAIKTLFALLFLILTVSGAFAADKKNNPEIKIMDNYIAVFDFEVTTGDKEISRPLTESVRREIVLSGKYDVIDRGNMNKILGEQKFQLSGCVAQECIVDAGQLLGVGKIISGTVSIVGKTYYLTLSLISVKTGKIEDVAEDICRCKIDELLGSTKRLAKKLIGEQVFPARAAVMKPATAAESKAEEIAKLAGIGKAKTEAEAAAKAKEIEKAKAEQIAKAKAETVAESKAKAKQHELKTTTAAIDPAVVSTKSVTQDGRFEKLASGVVRDTQSGLEWYAGPDKNTSSTEASQWAANLKIDGGGWRMPTLEELKGLYRKGAGSRNMTPLLETTGWWVWSGEKKTVGGGSWYMPPALDFDNGTEDLSYPENPHYKRGFAVRSRK
ncbi:MAG: hypothetical protein R6V76_05010 [Desulfobacterales bacterium]